MHPGGASRRNRLLETKAKSVGQPACRTSGSSVSKSTKRAHVDFTVVSGYLECLILVAVLIGLGIAEAVFENL
jgi:hypothetical protein